MLETRGRTFGVANGKIDRFAGEIDHTVGGIDVEHDVRVPALEAFEPRDQPGAGE
jgi:hypothetical protein